MKSEVHPGQLATPSQRDKPFTPPANLDSPSTRLQAVEGKQWPQREPVQAQREHKNSTQMDLSRPADSNPKVSSCETAILHHPLT